MLAGRSFINGRFFFMTDLNRVRGDMSYVYLATAFMITDTIITKTLLGSD